MTLRHIALSSWRAVDRSQALSRQHGAPRSPNLRPNPRRSRFFGSGDLNDVPQAVPDISPDISPS